MQYTCVLRAQWQYRSRGCALCTLVMIKIDVESLLIAIYRISLLILALYTFSDSLLWVVYCSVERCIIRIFGGNATYAHS